MPDKYLVPCDCGNRVLATVHQAGSQIACTCGNQVDVPPLRRLKQLPLADDQPAARAKPAWTPRHAATMGGAAVTAGLLLLAGYLWATEPPPPTFDQNRYAESVAGMLESGTPLQFWQHWMATHEQLAEQGFQEISSPQAEALEAYIADRQFYRKLVLGAAGVVAIFSIIAWLAWPRSNAA